MLAPQPKTRRLFETIQFVLAFASTCAVVEASRVESAPEQRAGYEASVPLHEAARDRSLGDLARVERKRREAEQTASRRGLELQVSEQRQLRA
jgi:hypothetical protein